MLDEAQFRNQSDEALTSLQRALEHASESHDFETDRNQGALSIEFEDPPARFVVSPNSPVRQIWVSAHSRSFKLDWDDARSAFVLRDTSQSLDELIASAIGQQLGEEVSL